jgi:hypothetical protein
MLSLLIGLAGAIGSGTGAAIMGFGPHRIIATAIVGFVSGILGWHFYMKPRLRHLDSFKRWL